MVPERETLICWKVGLVKWCAVALTKSKRVAQLSGGPCCSADGVAVGLVAAAFNLLSSRSAGPRSTVRFPVDVVEGMGGMSSRDL